MESTPQDNQPVLASDRPQESAIQQPAADEAQAPSDGAAFSWQASEYLHHDKKPGWFAILGLVTIGLVAVAVLAHQWFSIPVVVFMAAAILVYAIKPPRVLNYRIDDKGLTIEQKFHPFDDFRSFSVLQDIGWHTIDLEPNQRFMPRLTILFDNEHFAQIVSRLAEQLPEVDHQPDWVERLARYLKF